MNNPIYQQLKIKVIYVFTDGSCHNNGKDNAIAGIGVFFGYDDKRNVSERIKGKQTNNTAELSAIKKAIQILENEKDMIIICTDSEYCIKCCTTYSHKLEAKGWKKEIPNKELVKEVYELCKGRNIQFKHIEAHTNNDDFFSKGNNEADRLANESIGMNHCPYIKNYINVKFEEKDEAKRLGAKWDKNKKSWFYDNKLEEEKTKQLINKFSK